MTRLYISLFRALDVTWGEQVVTGLESRKAQELFCYLLLYRHRPHLREQLTTLLWDEADAAQGRKYLRQALWQLQNALDTGDPSAQPMLLADADWLQINPAAELSLDVADFEAAFNTVKGRRSQDLDDEQIGAMEHAVALYRGDLLEGWYHDWCLFERERLQNIYLVFLDKLMGCCEMRHDCDDGIAYGLRVLQLDPARERTHRRLMRLYYLAGDRTGALRQYDRCCQALLEELNVKPAWQTLKLCKHIRDGQPLPDLSPASAPPPPAGLQALLASLSQLNHLLYAIQRQVQRDIDAIKATLDE